MIWGIFKPVIDYYRVNELGPQFMDDFEYLATEMWKICKTRGFLSPGYEMGYLFDEFHQVFEPST
jgi:hypothetical protein